MHILLACTHVPVPMVACVPPTIVTGMALIEEICTDINVSFADRQQYLWIR